MSDGRRRHLVDVRDPRTDHARRTTHLTSFGESWFNTNYAGLRNRFGILSEAYAYATFEERVRASLRFVEEVLRFAADHAGGIRATVQQADRTSIVGTQMALRAVPLRSTTPSRIVLGATVAEQHPATGGVMLRRTDTTVVDVEQPLARLAVALIEPQSDDGLVNWNFLDEVLEAADAEVTLYPIVREP